MYCKERKINYITLYIRECDAGDGYPTVLLCLWSYSLHPTVLIFFPKLGLYSYTNSCPKCMLLLATTQPPSLSFLAKCCLLQAQVSFYPTYGRRRVWIVVTRLLPRQNWMRNPSFGALGFGNESCPLKTLTQMWMMSRVRGIFCCLQTASFDLLY